MEVETITVPAAAVTCSDSSDTSQHPGMPKGEAQELPPRRELGPANVGWGELACCAN